MDESTNRAWLTMEEADAFIGKNSHYYMDKWKDHIDSTLKGWNWAAMLFNVSWMAYRKMYVEVVIVYSVLFALMIFFALMFPRADADLFAALLGLITRIFLGLSGNMLYRKKAMRTFYNARGLKDSERLLYMRIKGGVSGAALAVCILLELATTLL